MLSASNVTSRDKALEMSSYSKAQTDVNVAFQNFIIFSLFFLLNGRFILFMRFDVTRLRSRVTRNKQMCLRGLKIRRFGICLWPSLGTLSFTHIYCGLDSDVGSSLGLWRRITELVRITKDATANQVGVISQYFL